MDLRLKANFVPSGNFGDLSVPYMLHKLNIPYIFCHHTLEKKVCMTGSILGIGVRKNTVVWGTGIIHNGISAVPDANYLAVRGPRTMEKLQKAGVDTTNVAMGDPCLLINRLYQPKVEKKYKLGIIPHIMDMSHYIKYFKENKDKFPNTIVIDPNRRPNNIETFIDEVNQCEKIVATAMHGIICAHAYGIPAIWSKIGNRLYGDDVKFHDYFESHGVFGVTPIEYVENEEIEVPEHKSSLDLDKLWDCRPWTNLSEEYYVDISKDDWVKECYPEGYTDKVHKDEHFKFN